MLARRFLWLVAAIIVVVIAGGVAYRLFGRQLLAAALVPGVSFADSRMAQPLDYAKAGDWLARPDKAVDPSRWIPGGAATRATRAAVFFVAPTAFFGRDRWTAPIDDAPTNARLALYLRYQASAFDGIGQVWAPVYRQATFGSFLTDKPDAARALDLAYGDVARAFAVFVAAIPGDQPIILAGHSQGSRHLLRLIAEHVAGTPLARRIVAVYAVGWPVDARDLATMHLPACASPSATGCVLSWRSYAEPAEVTDFREPRGLPVAGASLVCVNPLLGATGRAAVAAAANAGSLVPSKEAHGDTLVAHGVGAECRGSYLSIGSPPAGFDRYVLPGNNYHVYDYNLFWANVRADAERRVEAFGRPRSHAQGVG